MMANHENRASGSAPGQEHQSGQERHYTTIAAGAHPEGGDTDRLSARDQSSRLTTEVIAQTTKLAGQAGDQVSRLMTAQKDRAANGLHRLACALRDTTQDREQTEVDGGMATYTDRAAARLEAMSTYMRETQFPTMLRDAGQFARRRPEVLLAATVLTGLLVARLIQTSRRRPVDPWASATGRLHAAVQKGTQAVSAAADTLKQGAEEQYAAIARNRRRAAEKLTGPDPADLYRRVARWSRRRLA